MNPLLRASIELEHPFAFGAFFCAVFALGSSCSSDSSDQMNLSTGGTVLDGTVLDGTVPEASGGTEPQGTGARSSGATTGGHSSSNGSSTGTGGDPAMTPAPSSSSGCNATSQLLEGEHTFMLEGKERHYIVRLPEGYDAAAPQPLVLALHPNSSESGYWDSVHTGDGRAARDFFKDKAILVITEAIGGNWRDYNEDESGWDARVEEELLYFDQLLKETKAGLCVDEEKIFSIGFSGGGSFSGVLGCRRQEIRGFAADGAVIYFKPEDCVQNPAAWITIGDGEQNEPRRDFRDYFRDAGACRETSNPGTPDTCENYDSCGAQSPVTFCSHPAGHDLPPFFLTSSWNFFESLVENTLAK